MRWRYSIDWGDKQDDSFGKIARYGEVVEILVLVPWKFPCATVITLDRRWWYAKTWDEWLK